MGQALGTTDHLLAIAKGCNITETKPRDSSISSNDYSQFHNKTSGNQTGDCQMAELNGDHVSDLAPDSSGLKKIGNQTHSLMKNACNSNDLRDDDTVSLLCTKPTPTPRNHGDDATTPMLRNHTKQTLTPRNHGDDATTPLLPNRIKPTPSPRIHGDDDTASLLRNNTKPTLTPRNNGDDYTTTLHRNHTKATPTLFNHGDDGTTPLLSNNTKPTPMPHNHGYDDTTSFLHNHTKSTTTPRNQDAVNLATTMCGFVDQSYVDFYRVWSVIDSIFYFWLPVPIIVTANIATWIKVYRLSRESLTSTTALTIRRTRHVLILTSLISVGFLIFVTPLTVVLLIEGVLADDINYPLYNGETWDLLQLISEGLYLCNHSFNFFLYILSGKRFRNSLKAAFCKYER